MGLGSLFIVSRGICKIKSIFYFKRNASVFRSKLLTLKVLYLVFKFIMDSLSRVQLQKTQSGPPPIKDLAYELYIIGETEYLYGFIFSKDGIIIKYDYTAQKHEDGSYKIINDFNLDFLNRYFE